MGDFLFSSWPNGAGPMLVQLVLAIGGSALGVRAVDDVKTWREARARRKPGF